MGALTWKVPTGNDADELDLKIKKQHSLMSFCYCCGVIASQATSAFASDVHVKGIASLTESD